MHAPRSALLLPLLAAAALAPACASIVGLEDRTLDTTFGVEDAGAAIDAPATDDGGATPCDTYCDAIMSSCSGAEQQYASKKICIATCRALPEGEAMNPTGNTVACRAAEAELAVGEPPAYCSIAGPSGFLKDSPTSCGTPCDGYCAVMQKICPTQYVSDLGGTLADCKVACGQIPDLGKYSTSVTMGNSVQCRLYHLGAATQDPGTHCMHAAGEAVCK